MSIEVATKCCHTCEQILELENFPFRKDTNKYRNSCRLCLRKRVHEKKSGIVKTEKELLELKNKKLLRKKLKKSETAKQYREKNREKVIQAKKKYYEDNKEDILKKQKDYYYLKKDYINDRNAKWKKENKGLVVAYTRAYHLRKVRAMPVWADNEKISAIYDRAVRFSHWLGTVFHVDHIIPLKHPLVCGLHNEFNLQILPRKLNLKKSNKFNSNNFNELHSTGDDHAN